MAEVLDDGTCTRCLNHADRCTCTAAPARGGKRKKRKGPAVTPTSPLDRLPIEKRVGTRVRPEYAVPVFGAAKFGTMRHGTILRNERVYQGGGELGNFMYHRERVISIGLDVWERIQRGVDVIEMIDHRANRCFRITMDDARQFGYVYDAGIGPRWGVPVDLWAVEQGERPPLPGRPLDAPSPAATPAESPQKRLI